jgi:methylated-DNA-[protein]-cysteine S-methyltransferase
MSSQLPLPEGSGLSRLIKRMKNINIKTAKVSFLILPGPVGPVALLWSVYKGQPKISRVLLSKPSVSAKHQLSKLFPDSTAATCSEINVVANDIEAFFSGEDIQFSLEMFRMDLCSEFQQEVLRAEHRIPRGAVSTYQRIARHLGKLNGARIVGNALANNPFPIIVPCHRVIRTDLTIGGYQGGIRMKQTLLEMEGIDFNETWHIQTKNFFY